MRELPKPHRDFPGRSGMTDPCGWYPTDLTDERFWKTECGEDFTMETGTPKENGYKFCPNCGKPLMELPF